MIVATKWEKLAGDTSKFAARISFSDDPDKGVGATREESASWGSFQLWVNEQNLCAHRFGEELSESVHWYLLPLIEWIVTNWDPLLHEERLPNRNGAASAQESLRRTVDPPLHLTSASADLEAWNRNWFEWWSRHCFEAGRGGAVFPMIYLRRWQEKVEVSWQEPEGPARDTGVRFLCPSGTVRLPLQAVAEPLYTVLREAVQYLLSNHPDSERLRLLEGRAKKLEVARVDPWAWLLGFGTTFPEMRDSWNDLQAQVESQFPQKVREAILGSADGHKLFVDSFPAALMFGAVSPHMEVGDRLFLLKALAEALQDHVVSRINDLAEEVPLSGPPWEQGYELALDCLTPLGIDPDAAEPVNIEDILRQSSVTVKEVTLIDRTIRAVSIGGLSYRSTILVNDAHPANQFPSGRRFSLAHELCHLIYDRAHARDVTLPSGPWAPRDLERRANAFAAMLLMPPGRLTRAIAAAEAELASREGIMGVCGRLQTSFTSTVEHLCNLGLLDEEQRDDLLDEALAPQGRMQA